MLQNGGQGSLSLCVIVCACACVYKCVGGTFTVVMYMTASYHACG